MTNPNDPAYPAIAQNGDQYYGLTKRELFAAMAMQGIMSNHEYIQELRDEFPDKVNDNTISLKCVYIADALLAALEEKL